jgi:hypothetical protein
MYQQKYLTTESVVIITFARFGELLQAIRRLSIAAGLHMVGKAASKAVC